MSELLRSVAFWSLLAYLVAAIPVGLLLARARGIDLRSTGSGNIGATNAVRALGPKLGVLVFVLDVGKAFLPVYLAALPQHLGTTADVEWKLALVAFATVLGHVFPVYLRFRGGKGVACALGVLFGIDPPMAVVALVMYVQGLVLTRTSAIGSLFAVNASVLAMFVAGRPWAFRSLAVAIATTIWLRHRSNVAELMSDAKARKSASRS